MQGKHCADRINDTIHGPYFVEVDLVYPDPMRGCFGLGQGSKDSDALFSNRLRESISGFNHVADYLEVAIGAVVMMMMVVIVGSVAVRVRVRMGMRVVVVVRMPSSSVRMLRITVVVRVCVGMPMRVAVRGVHVHVVMGVIVRVGVGVRVRVAVGLPSLVGVRVGMCVRMRVFVRVAFTCPVLVAMLVHTLSSCSLRSTTHRHFLMPVDGADLDVGRGNVPFASHHLFHVQIPFLRQRQDRLEPRHELVPRSAL